MTSDPDGGRQAPRARAPCSKVVALLADYLEGRLQGERHAELTRHLDDCHSCLAQLQTYRSTVSLLRSLREADLPSDLRLTLSAFLDHHADNGARGGRLFARGFGLQASGARPRTAVPTQTNASRPS